MWAKHDPPSQEPSNYFSEDPSQGTGKLNTIKKQALDSIQKHGIRPIDQRKTGKVCCMW